MITYKTTIYQSTYEVDVRSYRQMNGLQQWKTPIPYSRKEKPRLKNIRNSSFVKIIGLIYNEKQINQK